jgi:predicted enzyme related to lactoylglutathione lyase
MPHPVVHFEIGCRDSAKTQEFYGKLFNWKNVFIWTRCDDLRAAEVIQVCIQANSGLWKLNR